MHMLRKHDERDALNINTISRLFIPANCGQNRTEYKLDVRLLTVHT